MLGYTDYFVVCSGNTERQTKAIHDGILEGCKHEHEIQPRRVEGLSKRDWILMDYLDVVVHIFTPETRAFYRLEQLWGEAPSRVAPSARKDRRQALARLRLRVQRARAAAPGRAPPRRWRGRRRRDGKRAQRDGSVKQNSAKAKNPAIRPRPSRRNSSAPRWVWVNTASTLETTGNGASSPLSREPSQPDAAASASTSSSAQKARSGRSQIGGARGMGGLGTRVGEQLQPNEESGAGQDERRADGDRAAC